VHEGFLKRLTRVVFVLGLTGTAVVGGILWQANRLCPHPCSQDGSYPPVALKQRPMPPRW
jgi:hypothetical protein